MKYLEYIVETDCIDLLLDLLDNKDYVESILIEGIKGFEVKDKNIPVDELIFSRYLIKIFLQTKLNNNQAKEFIEFVNSTFIMLKVRTVSFKEKIDSNDYVNKSYLLKPILIDDFYLAFNDDDYIETKNASKNLKVIFLKVSTAFGTGEHETTSMCLELINYFVNTLKCSNIKSIIDMGCGSGILAFACFYNFKEAEILAVDNDALAIKVVDELVNINNMRSRINVINSMGFEKLPNKKAQIILANILQKPLLEMANNFYNYLDNNGYIILSGFLREQYNEISFKYKELGFKEIICKYKNGWCAILMQKIGA